MKTLIYFKTFLLISALILFFLFIDGCTTVEIPEEVCLYGLMTCDAGSYICNNYELPPEVCTYFNVACVNLQVLCNAGYGSDEYKMALKKLNEANLKFNNFVLESSKK